MDQPPLTYCYGCGRPEPTLEGVNVAVAGLNQRSGRQPPAGQRFPTVFPRSTAVPSCRTIGHRTPGWLQARQTHRLWCLWSRLVSYHIFSSTAFTVRHTHQYCLHVMGELYLLGAHLFSPSKTVFVLLIIICWLTHSSSQWLSTNAMSPTFHLIDYQI